MDITLVYSILTNNDLSFHSFCIKDLLYFKYVIQNILVINRAIHTAINNPNTIGRMFSLK